MSEPMFDEREFLKTVDYIFDKTQCLDVGLRVKIKESLKSLLQKSCIASRREALNEIRPYRHITREVIDEELEKLKTLDKLEG